MSTVKTKSYAFKINSKECQQLQSFLEFLNDWEKLTNRGEGFISKTTAEGFRVTIHSTLSLLKYLVNEVGYAYMMTSRLSQDSLENLFGIIRQSSGSNDHPSPTEFLTIVDCLTYYHLAKPPNSGNAQENVISALLDAENSSEQVNSMLDGLSIIMAENNRSNTGIKNLLPRKFLKQVDNFKVTLNEMRKNRVNTDVVIESDGEEFHVHKLILTTGSIYFQKMFENNLHESTSNRVKFPTIKKDNMEFIIDFLYFSDSDLPGNCDIVINLFQAAHLLEIEALVEKCWVHLVNNIDLSNWFKVWKLGDIYGFNVIIANVVEFTVKNLSSILKREEFLDLDFQNVLKVIQELNIQKLKCTDHIMKGILDWAKKYKERENSLAKLLTSFSEIDVSNDFLESLLFEEPIIENNSEVLCMFLKLQLRKIKNNSHSEHNKTKKALSICEILSYQEGEYLMNSGNNLKINTSQQMPFKIKNGMSSVSDGHYIYFVGGEDEFIATAGEASNSGKGSTTFIRYDYIYNECAQMQPLTNPVFNPLVFIYFNKLFVIERKTANSSKCSGQIFTIYDEYYGKRESGTWKSIEIPDAMNDAKMIYNVNSNILCFH